MKKKQQQQQQPQLATMRSSQTMPQLFYTRQDIHEQYLANKPVNAARASSSGPQKGQRSKLVTGEQKHSSNATPSYDSVDENEDPESGEQHSSNQEGRGRRSGRSRKRRQRSHSAGFFSGCFNLPHLSSILHPSAHTTGDSTGGGKRSGFLAHLGIRSSSSSRPTISSSQTTGNLRQLDSSLANNNLNEEFNGNPAIKPSSSSNLNSNSRKHVSFGSHTPQATTLQNSPQEEQNLVRSQQQQLPITQQRQLVSEPAKASSSNTVIMRNYQAHPHSHPQHQQQQQQQQQQRQQEQLHPHLSEATGSITSANTITANTSPMQPPIYLVSQVPTGRSVGPSANQPASVYGRSSNVNSSHLPPIMQAAQPYSTQVSQSNAAHASSRQPTSCPTHPVRRPQQPATLYKRLPAVPMRTQATQTDITAYHLMSGTPPFTSTPNSARLVRAGPDTPCSSATVAPSQSELQSSDETPIHPHSSKDSFQTRVGKVPPARNPSKDDGSDEWSVDEEERELGQVDASEQARRVSKQFSSSSSSSSSSHSLIGHVDLSGPRLAPVVPLTSQKGVDPDAGEVESSVVMDFCEVGMASDKDETIDTSYGLTRALAPVSPASLGRSDASIMSQQQEQERVTALSFNDQNEAGDDSGERCSTEADRAQRERRLKNYNGRPCASCSSRSSSSSSETIATIEPPSQFKDDGCCPELALGAESPVLSLSEASSQTDPPSAGVAQFKLELSRSFARPTVFSGFPSSDLTTPTTSNETTSPSGTLTRRKEPVEGVCQMERELVISLPAGQQRRNDFLTLQTEQHDEQPETLAGLISDPFEDATGVLISQQQQQHQASSSQGGSSKRSSTSTLSTRHHSYCSSDDFHQDNLLLAQQTPAAVTNQQQLLELQLGPNSASCSAELEEIDEILGDNEPRAAFSVDATTSNLSAKSFTTLLQSGDTASVPLSSAATHSTNECDWIEQETEIEDETVAKTGIQAGGSLANLAQVSEEANRLAEDEQQADSFTSSATIKPDCSLAGFMMAAGDHKILSASASSSSSSSSSILKVEPSKEIAIEPAGQVVSAGSTIQAEEEKPLNSSSNLSSVSSQKIKEEESLATTTTTTTTTSIPRPSALCTLVSNQPDNRRDLPAASDVDCPANKESRKCSTSSKTRSSEEDESLPTSVSELDMDEQLSTPSFVDSYRNRVDQVCELADSMLGQILDDLIGGAGKTCVKVQQDEGQVSSSSSSNSPTTSLESCPRRIPRPIPPKKPAHLRATSGKEQKCEVDREKGREREQEGCSEAAAALAVTATSIAAAALLHQQQSEHIKESVVGCVVKNRSEDKEEQPEVAATPPLPINLLEELDEDSEEFERPRSLLAEGETKKRDEEEIASSQQMLEINDNVSSTDTEPQTLHSHEEEESKAEQVGVLDSEPESSTHAGSSVRLIPILSFSSDSHVVLSGEQEEAEEAARSAAPVGGEVACGSSCSLSSVSQNLDQNNNKIQVPTDEFVASEGQQQLSLIDSRTGAPDDGSSLAAYETPQVGQQVALYGELAIHSQELSTVSELSEEAPMSQRQHQPAEPLELGVEAEGACPIELAEPATELDLAQSEYTLRSQASELEPLSSESAEPFVREDNLEQRHLSDSNMAHDTSSKLTSRSTTLSPMQSRQHSKQQKQLAHDDTMEAFSIDDYAVGENELSYDNEQQQQPHLDPPAGFSGEPPVPEWPHPPEPDSILGPEPPDFRRHTNLPAETLEDEEDDEESSISVSQQGVLVQSLERPTSADDKSPRNIVAVKSLSTESATDAILEHLSRHHHRRTELPPLDEPAPALEESRSVGQSLAKTVPSQSSTGSALSLSSASASGSVSASASARRESWKRESLSLKSPTEPPTLCKNTPPPVELPVESMGEEGSSGTIKRRVAAAAPVVRRDDPDKSINEATSGTSSQTRRGPPLAQMKCLQQPSGSQLTDTSICSSCSCMEQPTEVALADGTAEEKGKRLAALNPVAQWMSQEEGTVFTENYWLAHWLYISEHEESEIWRRAIDMSAISKQSNEEEQFDQQQAAGMPDCMPEVSSTVSERNFSTKYKSITRKMIHRRATLEMYKRIMNNNLRREKRVEINRSNGEFGFRIHGSRPVVVSAIERGTSAETCGLQVGDLIYAINDTNILDMAHSDVVKLAHKTNSCSLILDLVPTNDFLKTSKYNRANNKRYEPIVTGYLMRLSPSTAQPLLVELQERMARATQVSAQQRAVKLNEVMRLAWRKRYFVLRSDNCLYWYRSPRDIEPYGGVNLQGFSASLTNEFSEPTYVIRLVKYGIQPHYLGTNKIGDIQTWVDAINKAATEANQNDPYMRRTLTLARTPPNQIPEPECSGYLYKFSHKRSGGAHWRAAYFVLKDACLYLFRDQQTDSVSQASAVYYLHGYRVRNKHIEHKKYTFELIPPNRKTIRPIFLMANSETDRKRWIAALEYSIDRWIEIS